MERDGWLKDLEKDLEAGTSRNKNRHERRKMMMQRFVTTLKKEKMRGAPVDQLDDSIQTFADHVTMAGVHDVKRAENTLIKAMFVTAILLSSSGLLFTSVRTILSFMYPDIVYDRFPVVDVQPPFPNVSVCGPLSINRTIFNQSLIIPERTVKLARRNNVSMDEIIEFTLDFWRTDRYPREITNQVIATASIQIMDASVRQYSKGYTGLLMSTYPECTRIFSNCHFFGREFNCCQVARFVHTSDSICYHFNVQRIPNWYTSGQGGGPDGPKSLATTGLTVNITYERDLASFYDDLAQEGFRVTVGPLPGGHTSPVAVPSSMDAVITIAARKDKEISDCRDITNLPKMEFFDYYDPTGITYYYDLGPLHGMVYEAGCDYPILSHIPENTTLCKPLFFYILKTLNQFKGVDVQRKGKTKIRDWDMHKQMLDQRRLALPICDRWSYEIASASYGFMHKQGNPNWHMESIEDSPTWSRITVFFPSASYLLRIEKPVGTPYTAVWRIGGLATAYIGLSMIGLVQLLVYGTGVCYAAARKYAAWTY